MIKRARKISLTVLTAMLMAVTTISPAFAADDVQTTTEAGTKQTTVTYTQDSSLLYSNDSKEYCLKYI